MDVYILNLIFTNQENKKNLENPTNTKKQTGIHFKNLFPLVLQDKFLNIKSKSGVYSAIERMKKDELIEITRIKKIPPEIIINLKKKGKDELKEFLKILPKSESKPNSPPKQTQKQHQEKSEIKFLKQSLEESQSHKILPKKTNVGKKMMDLDENEYNNRVKRIKDNIIDCVNMGEDDFSKDQLEIIEETAEKILDFARK